MKLIEQIDNYRYARRYSMFYKGRNEVKLTDYIEFPKLSATFKVVNSIMARLSAVCVGLLKIVKKTTKRSN